MLDWSSNAMLIRDPPAKFHFTFHFIIYFIWNIYGWQHLNQPERPIRSLEETFFTFYSRVELTFNLCQITIVISRTLALNGTHIQIRNCLGIVGLQLFLNQCILMYIATVVDVYWGWYRAEGERIKLIVCMQFMRGLHRKTVLFVSEPDTRVS